MKVKTIVAPLLAIASLLAVSRLMRGREVSMHPLDWEEYDGLTPRRYRSAGHVMHHALDLMAMNIPLTEIYLRRSISPAFREQVMIVTASANNCPPWLSAHTAFGRNAGLTGESVDALVTIDSEVLDAKEVTSLVWVRSILTSREGVPAVVEERFRTVLTEDEQVYVQASMKGMFCTNLLVNTARHLSARLTGDDLSTTSCPYTPLSD